VRLGTAAVKMLHTTATQNEHPKIKNRERKALGASLWLKEA